MAGFAPVDEKYPSRDAAFQAVAKMRATKTPEWAFNRCHNERQQALDKADNLQWYLRYHDYYKTWKRNCNRDREHEAWYRKEAERLEHFAGVVQAAIDVVTEAAKADGTYYVAIAQRNAQLQENEVAEAARAAERAERAARGEDDDDED
eukprot:9156374-Alexandrium_andersonii.AAC.1